MAKVLTAIAIKNARPPEASRLEIPDGGCRGLYLVIQPSGAKSWALRYRHNGKPYKLTLGTVLVLEGDETEPTAPAIDGALTLAAARKLATDAMHKVDIGGNPALTKKDAAQGVKAAQALDDTFEVIAKEYLRRCCKNVRTADERRVTLERLVYPDLGAKRIGEIKRTDIVRLLDKIEDGEIKSSRKQGRGGPVMADRTLALIRIIMNWHATRSDDFRSPIVRGMAKTKSSERARQRTLNDDELRAVWLAAEADEGPFGALVQFLLMTSARRCEASEMLWPELSGSDWTLPKCRNKTKQEDLVRPLSDEALAVLDRMRRKKDEEKGDFVFRTPTGALPVRSFSKFKRKFDKDCGVTGWSLHDLRRTARSLMGRAGVPSDHAERVLGHVIGGVRGVYDRWEYYKEKKQALDALAKLINRIVYPRSNVRQLRPRARRAS